MAWPRALGLATWRLLLSVRAAVVLLILLSALSLVGTFIPQRQPAAFYRARWGAVGGGLMTAAGLDRVYRSWAFLGLGLWLNVSMAACAVNRWRALRRQAAARVPWPNAEERAQAEASEAWPWPRPAATAAAVCQEAAAALSAHRYRVLARAAPDGAPGLLAERGWLGRYGSLTIHCSVMVILVGGALSALCGHAVRVDVPEGDRVAVPGTPLALHLHAFSARYYPGTQLPRDYASAIELFAGGQSVAMGRVKVNEPFRHEGYWVYQMSYRKVVERVVLSVAPSGGAATAEQEVVLTLGEAQAVPALGVTLLATDFAPDFALTADGQPATRSEEFNNPAVRVAVRDAAGAQTTAWVFPFAAHGAWSGGEPAAAGGLRLRLANYPVRLVSGLRVTKDPGRPVVYVGFIVLILGTLLNCYVFHRRYWLAVRPAGGGWQVAVLGQAGRNRLEFGRDVARLRAALAAAKG